MGVEEYLPVWDKLTKEQQELVKQVAVHRHVTSGTLLHDGSKDCLGLILVCTGQLRAYIVSEEGREVTVYRMFDRDVSILSASCMMQNIQFDIFIEAEKDCEIWIIPAYIFMKLMEESSAMAKYANDLLAGCLSDVMWLMEQIMWKSFDKRLAEFLLEECVVADTHKLSITHEKIANHLGTAREVVTRMLRYFQSEGMVKLTRGTVEIIDEKKLRCIGEAAC